MRSLAVLAALCAAVPLPSLADERSEAAAAELLHRRLQNENPEDAALLRSVHGKLVVVVRGSMDHIEQVLSAARIEHTIIEPRQVAGYPLKANMIVMVDCPGVMPDAGVQRLQRFVRAGGLLYTTDWALKNVVEKAFPGTIAHNGRGTGDELVPVTIDQQGDNLMSRMLMRREARPQWYLEGSSYPIRILDRKRVEVLAHSDEMRIRYGAAPVVVRFRWEDGEVIHVVSHFYRQLNARGPQVATAKVMDSYEGLTAKDKAELKKAPKAQAPAADVESSYAFQRMTTNLVTGKQRRNKELERSYNMTVKAPVPLMAEPSAGSGMVAQEAQGNSLRVLKRADKKALVRDEEGNEGWVAEESLVAK
jgi:hypothetical protein